MPFAGFPQTAESPEGDFAVPAATSVAGQPGDALHDFTLAHRQGVVQHFAATASGTRSATKYGVHEDATRLMTRHAIRRDVYAWTPACAGVTMERTPLDPCLRRGDTPGAVSRLMA